LEIGLERHNQKEIIEKEKKIEESESETENQKGKSKKLNR
jgi:hypothetical protein